MEKINVLLEWAKANGAEISEGIHFSKLGEANIGAKWTSSPGKATIRVPSTIIIKLLDAVSGFGESHEEELTALTKKTKNINCVFKMFLAHERSQKETSFFAPYITALPTSKEIDSPYVWAPLKTQYLQGSNLGSSLRENISQLVEEWWLVVSTLPEAIPKPAPHFENMKFFYEFKFFKDQELYEYLLKDDEANWTSFPAYLWSTMICKSRSFPSALLKDSGNVKSLDLAQPDVVMLLPVVDLLNHNPQAEVTWSSSDGSFVFETDADSTSPQLFNNYGRKGNEELLLAYGFCLENNSADSVALKIKIPLELLPQLEKTVELPRLSDYTTSVVSENTENNGDTLDKYQEFKDGLLFFVNKDRVPENLIQVFQFLVKNAWDGDSVNLRMQLSGLNHLRQALDSKAALIDTLKVPQTPDCHNILLYLTGQKKALRGAVSKVKHMETELLAANKGKVLSLKTVYNRDTKFSHSLLVTMGVTNYEDILDQELMDQVWLLYLVRCYNREHYIKTEADEEDNYLPEWIRRSFERMDAETEIAATEVVQFQHLYNTLIIPMNQTVPEIYNVGKWTVRELIVSTRLLDTIGFVRGKKQECLLVEV